jgi:hypothetical protein
VFSVEAAPVLCKDPRPAELELRESLEVAVEDDSEEMAREEIGSEKKTSYVL